MLSVGSEVMELIWWCSFLWNEGRGTSKEPGGSVSIYCSGLGTGLKNQARGATKRGGLCKTQKVRGWPAAEETGKSQTCELV